MNVITNLFLSSYRLAETFNNLDWNHLQNDLCHENDLIQTLEVLLFYLALFLILFFSTIHLFFINNQKFKQLPQKPVIC